MLADLLFIPSSMRSSNNAIRKLENGTVSTFADLSNVGDRTLNPWHVAIDPMNKTMFIAVS